MISNFQELLTMATQQKDAQRLLFLFASTELSESTKKADANHGTITPAMCVDKLPGELSTFAHLVAEADGVNEKWDLVFIAGLSGDGNRAPSSEEADPYLNRMTNDLSSGQDLSRYVVFDRQENPIVIQSN